MMKRKNLPSALSAVKKIALAEMIAIVSLRKMNDRKYSDFWRTPMVRWFARRITKLSTWLWYRSWSKR